MSHDRSPGADARARDRAMHLLDIRRDAGLVGGALEERGLDLGPLDPLLDVVYEEVRHRVLVAEHEVGRQVVVGVDPGARNDLEARLLGDAAREAHVAAAEHRRGLADRLHASLDRGGGALDRRPIGAVLVDRYRRLGLPDGAGVRPLRQHRLVAEDQVLVDERGAEVLGIDRPGHGADRHD